MSTIVNLAEARPVQLDEAIAFVDLKAQQARIRDGIEARIKAVLDHGRYILGPEIGELETLLSARTSAPATVACASGTDALVIPMLAKGVGRGDAVFLPGFTYNATANAIALTGATPVFVDVRRDSFNIDTDDLAWRIDAVREEGRLTPRAIIAVDLFGLPADYPALGRLAEANDLLLIADAAQSFGGRLNGAEVGTLAPITATSFYPGKALGCYGDGGAVFCMDTDDEAVLRSVLFHGTDESRGESIRIGLNGRLDTMQAAVLLEKAAIFDDELNVRRRIARIYEDRLGAFADLQTAADGFESSCGYFSLCVDDRDGVCGRLKAAGVPTAVYYRKPLHKMAAFAEFGPSSGLPVCEELSERILSLPIHAYLTDAQAHRICDAFEAAIGR